MKLTDGQQKVMISKGHLLVTGGPGSGKTTISVLKAAQIIEQVLKPWQSVLFLSFARATVSRVTEAIEHEQQIAMEQKRLIEVQTYHSLFWRILKTHGYLIGLPRRLTILPPQEEAVSLSEIRASFPSNLTSQQRREKREAENNERQRLAMEEGRVCFDLFAPYVGEILQGSERIRCLIANKYPTIILDEFQDTNHDQWCVVQELGKNSRLIALADPEQRIFGWIGADPARLDHFREEFNPDVVELGSDNHRSTGTDITTFGDDILTGKFQKQKYQGIEIDFFEPFADPAMTKLVTKIYSARKRLIETGTSDWSLAILVPTKKMTRLVSDALHQPPAGMAPLPHSTVVDIDGLILASEIIALLLQPDMKNHFDEFVGMICNYYRGKGGDNPSQKNIKEAKRIQKAYEDMLTRRNEGKDIRRNSILINMINAYEQARRIDLTGNPDKDWQAIREALENGPCSRLKGIAEEVRNLRILERGALLRQELSREWRENGCYNSALEIVRQVFVQEHFSMSAKPETGIIVMNMHKAKGKQFDEVIIFEGWPRAKDGRIKSNPDRIVRGNIKENINDQTCYSFRVSVTRSRLRTTILTPRNDPCVLLLGRQ